jgi:hypothetical protein
MRKLTLTALAIASLAIPVTASADDIPDGADCAATTGPSLQVPAGPDGDNDRGYACVAGGGVAVAYIGGELQAEEEGNPDAGGACGAVIVGGQVLSGNADWDNAGPDGEEGTEDDQHCD